MTPQTLDATAHANGKVTTAAPNEAQQDPILEVLEAGDGTSAPMSDAEAEYLRSGVDAPSASDVQPTAESPETGGEQVDGEESAESEGEEPEGDKADLEASEKVWKDALALANGDPKKALEIARLALGAEDEKEAAAGPDTIAQAVEAEVSADVDRFYKERGDDKAGPDAESRALVALFKRREVALLQKVGQVMDQFDSKLKQRTEVSKATKELWSKHPDWKKDEPALLRFIQSTPGMRSVPPLHAYRAFLADKADRGAPVNAKKAAVVSAAATRKAFQTSAQASAGGRPGGPTTRKPLTTEQREVLTARQMPGRLRLP